MADPFDFGDHAGMIWAYRPEMISGMNTRPYRAMMGLISPPINPNPLGWREIMRQRNPNGGLTGQPGL